MRATMQWMRDPFNGGAMESMATLAHAIPTGLFDNRSIGDFLRNLFAASGRTDDFRKLGRKLFLVATNLDTGASVNFGAPGRDHVPISIAIEASAALPGLFPPVRIGCEYFVDGALNKTLHASVAQTVTSCPRSRKSRTAWLPMYPAPPVTRIFMIVDCGLRIAD